MKVYYSPKMLGPPQEHSPSAHKPGRVVESWLAIEPRLKLIEPPPLTVEQLCLAHDREFVTDILAGRVSNGFGNSSREVAASLPYTSGAMLAAARAAIAGRTATIAPCSDDLRDLILSLARRPDVHSVSCPFRDAELWEGLLREQLRRAQASGQAPQEA